MKSISSVLHSSLIIPLFIDVNGEDNPVPAAYGLHNGLVPNSARDDDIDDDNNDDVQKMCSGGGDQQLFPLDDSG